MGSPWPGGSFGCSVPVVASCNYCRLGNHATPNAHHWATVHIWCAFAFVALRLSNAFLAHDIVIVAARLFLLLLLFAGPQRTLECWSARAFIKVSFCLPSTTMSWQRHPPTSGDISCRLHHFPQLPHFILASTGSCSLTISRRIVNAANISNISY